jgi:hypothetical protein
MPDVPALDKSQMSLFTELRRIENTRVFKVTEEPHYSR